MKRVCAWCGDVLKGSKAGCRGGISYGICLPCVNSILNDSPGLMREYVDQIDCPVALLSGDGVVVTANQLACALLHKELGEIEGLCCGEVFGCAAPGEPQGCGGKSECAGCEIKRCVTHTHRTGKRLSRIPATLRYSPEAAEDAWWLISTSKFMDCVVVRIAGRTRVRKVKAEGLPRRHSSAHREKRGTDSPSSSTVSQNIASGLTQSAPSP